MSSSPRLRVLFFLRKVDCNDGIATYCRTLAGSLSNSNVSVSMISGEVNASHSEEGKRIALDKTLEEWHVLPSLRKLPSPIMLFKIIGIIRNSRIDIINIHGLGMLIWGKILSLILNVPVVATYHPSASSDMIAANDGRSLTFFERSVLLLCAPSILVVLSSDSKRFLVKNCSRIESRIRIVPGGGDDTIFRMPTEDERVEAREKLGLAPTEICILNVSRLAAVKRQELIIEAARHLRRDDPGLQCKFFFVGSGDAERTLKDVAYKEPQDAEAFHFTGFVHDQIYLFYWAADIFVLPSLFEGFPLSAVEAMFCGLPIIRTPAGGVDEQIIQGVTGLVVPFDDSRRLSLAIKELCDPHIRLSIGKNSYEHSRANFTAKVFSSRILSIYMELL